MKDFIEESSGLGLELLQTILMVTAVRGFVHGIHETETLQGTLPTFDWSALGKLVGVLLQRLLNGIELFGDSCGWAERGRQMHVRGRLLELTAHLLFTDKLRYLLHVFRIDCEIDRCFDSVCCRRCDDSFQEPTFARHRLPLSTLELL